MRRSELKYINQSAHCDYPNMTSVCEMTEHLKIHRHSSSLYKYLDNIATCDPFPLYNNRCTYICSYITLCMFICNIKHQPTA